MSYEITLENIVGEKHTATMQLNDQEKGWIAARRFWAAQQSAVVRAIRQAPDEFFLFTALRFVHAH
jgi:hypothetical protein